MAFAGRLRPKQNFNSPKNSNSMQFIDRLNYINNFHLNIDKICVEILAKLRFRTANGVCKAHHLCRRSNDSLKGSDSEMCRKKGKERGGQLFNQLNWWLELFKLKWKVIILRFVFEIRNLASEYFPSKFSHNAQWNTIRFTCFILTLKRIEFWLKSTITTN